MKISEWLSKECNSETWLSNQINYIKYTDEELKLAPCPKCGHEVKIHLNRENDGYCSYISAKIKCTNCFIQTASRCVDGYYGCTGTINDLINEWNE